MKKIIPMIDKLSVLFENLINGIYSGSSKGWFRYLNIVWLLTLYLGGLWLWWYFLNGGEVPTNIHDWAEAAPRYTFLKDAMTNLKLPLHMPAMSPLRNVTDRYIAVVDTNISPLAFLLRVLDYGEFILTNTLILYSIGFVGLVLIKKKYRLSPIIFTILFFTILFNGHIQTHLAVGHVHWATYLMLPLFAYLIFKIIDGMKKWMWILSLSILLFFFVLQGAFHLFVVCLFFLLVMALSNSKVTIPVLLACLFAVLLSMVRILPALLVAGEMDTEFLSGFTTVFELDPALLRLQLPSYIGRSTLTQVGWWERDFYIGIIPGVIILIFFVVWVRKRHKIKELNNLFIPIFALTFFSIGKTYKLFHIINFPMLSSQRVSTRLFILPLVLTLLITGIYFQRDEAWKIKRKWLFVGLISLVILMAQDIWQHIRAWRVVNIGAVFPPVDVNLSQYVVANHPDQAYISMLVFGGLTSMITMLLLIAMVLKETRQAASKEHLNLQ